MDTVTRFLSKIYEKNQSGLQLYKTEWEIREIMHFLSYYRQTKKHAVTVDINPRNIVIVPASKNEIAHEINEMTVLEISQLERMLSVYPKVEGPYYDRQAAEDALLKEIEIIQSIGAVHQRVLEGEGHTKEDAAKITVEKITSKFVDSVDKELSEYCDIEDIYSTHVFGGVKDGDNLIRYLHARIPKILQPRSYVPDKRIFRSPEVYKEFDTYAFEIFPERVKDMYNILTNIKCQRIIIPGDGMGIGTFIARYLGMKVVSGDSSKRACTLATMLRVGGYVQESMRETIYRGLNELGDDAVIFISHLVDFDGKIVFENIKRKLVVFENRQVFLGCNSLIDTRGNGRYVRVTDMSIWHGEYRPVSMASRVNARQGFIPIKLLTDHEKIVVVGDKYPQFYDYLVRVFREWEGEILVMPNTHSREVVNYYGRSLNFAIPKYHHCTAMFVYDWSIVDISMLRDQMQVVDGNTYEFHHEVDTTMAFPFMKELLHLGYKKRGQVDLEKSMQFVAYGIYRSVKVYQVDMKIFFDNFKSVSKYKKKAQVFKLMTVGSGIKKVEMPFLRDIDCFRFKKPGLYMFELYNRDGLLPPQHIPEHLGISNLKIYYYQIEVETSRLGRNAQKRDYGEE